MKEGDVVTDVTQICFQGLRPQMCGKAVPFRKAYPNSPRLRFEWRQSRKEN